MERSRVIGLFVFSLDIILSYYCQVYMRQFFISKYQFFTFNCKMGQCIRGTGKTTRGLQKKHSKLFQEQLLMLGYIFDDLAARSPEKVITLEIFLLFFHKKSFWSEYIYRQFPKNRHGITRDQFIQGVDFLYKIDQQSRAQNLFSFFSDTDRKSTEGISYSSLISILYSYPKEDLENILDDPEFLKDYVLKVKPLTLENQSTSNELKVPKPLNFENAPKRLEVEINSEYTESRLDSHTADEIKEIIFKANVKANTNTFSGKIDGQEYLISTKNFNGLIKKYAKKIFQQNNLDIETDKLQKDNFQNLLKGHPKIYMNYYEGFHEEIWGYDSVEEDQGHTYFPKYTRQKCLICSECEVKGEFHTLFLINNFIIAENFRRRPVFIILLEGLSIKPINKANNYFLEFSSSAKCYTPKVIKFKSQQIRDEWFQKLRAYQGINIYEKYIFNQQVGAGAYSNVYAGINKKTNEKCAIKQIEKSKHPKEVIQSFRLEDLAMKMFDNPYLIKHIETIETNQHIYIITELVENAIELKDFVKKYNSLSEKQIKDVMKQLICGVKEVHKKGYIHRDLKPENVLVVEDPSTQDLHIKIIDFGFAIRIQQCEYNIKKNQACCDNIVGSPGFICPEYLKQDIISEKSDVYALGAILYFMVSGMVPCVSGLENNYTQILYKTIDGSINYLDVIWKNYSLETKKLAQKMLQREPQNRFTIANVLAADWFKLNTL